MAVSWFENWKPPSHIFPDHHQFAIQHPVSNVSHKNDQQQQHYAQISNLLPFFLQLGILDVDKFEAPLEERTGPFLTNFQWKVIDFAYETPEKRQFAINSKKYIPENNLPLGLEIYKNRLFITLPRWKKGVPATLAFVPIDTKEKSPKLIPYPSWQYNSGDSCQGLTSVFRIQVDTCNRLWVLDSGQINVTKKPLQVCPPALYIFDLLTNNLLLRYELPKPFIKQDSLYSNLLVDIRDNDCVNVHAYLTDVWRYGLVVFSLEKLRSWRITDHLFYPEPLAAAYNLHGLEFEWVDGLFALALSPYRKGHDRTLYFHPMSSFREFYVKTSVVCNETGWSSVKGAFRVMGQSRGKFGHVSASAMARNGVMFYNLVTRDEVGCWDSRKPYKRDNLGVVAKSTKSLVFPNDLKVDNEEKQKVWVLSNRLPFFLYKGLNRDDFNFRVMSADVDAAIKGTICDPEVRYFDTFRGFTDGSDCY